MTMGWMLLERRALAILIKGGGSVICLIEKVWESSEIEFYLILICHFFNCWIKIPNYYYINIYNFIIKGSPGMHATNLSTEINGSKSHYLPVWKPKNSERLIRN